MKQVKSTQREISEPFLKMIQTFQLGIFKNINDIGTNAGARLVMAAQLIKILSS